MLIPVSKPIQSDLSKQFQQRSIKKQYTAILNGHINKEEGCIDLPLITDWPNRPKQKVCHETGKPSETRYKVLEYLHEPMASKVAFTPITGRSHQLRIHSLELGHPILGCQLYCRDGSDKLSKRLMLHANLIEFQHPVSQKTITLECPSPF